MSVAGNLRSTPLVSVVMPTLQQAEFIKASVNSVLSQSYANIELIIADGGSTDGTPEVLRELAAQDHRLRWFSKNDNGPAQALNRALQKVRGTIIGWLNSDDLYTPHAITHSVIALTEHPEWLMVYGEGEHVDIFGKVLNRYPTLPPSTPLQRFSEGCFICQPTVFFRRSQYVLLGPLDESLKTAFDFEYWLRAFHAFPERIGFIDAVQAQSRLHENCITLYQRKKVFIEGMQVLARYLGFASPEWVISYMNEIIADKHTLSATDIRAFALVFLTDVKGYLRPEDEVRLLEKFSI